MIKKPTTDADLVFVLATISDTMSAHMFLYYHLACAPDQTDALRAKEHINTWVIFSYRTKVIVIPLFAVSQMFTTVECMGCGGSLEKPPVRENKS